MKIPINLEECFKYFKRNYEVEELHVFSSKFIDKNGFIEGCHFLIGMNIRNRLGLWRRNKLTKYFNKLGIYHADDMSGIILTSFHRYLNKKNIKLREQVKYYRNYWKEHGFKNGNPLEKK